MNNPFLLKVAQRKEEYEKLYGENQCFLRDFQKNSARSSENAFLMTNCVFFKEQFQKSEKEFLLGNDKC